MEAIVRPARPADKKDLMGFIREVWGGHDYIPYVWDSWLRDRDGKMFVAEVGGRAVGMNRVRFLRDGSAWFEGARVHPAYRGQGLASMLGENSMKVAALRGATVYRLVSGSRNKTAHRQIARMRFAEASRISVYSPAAGTRLREDPGARRARGQDRVEVASMVERSREFRLGAGVYWNAFAAASLTPSVIRGLVEEGRVWTSGGAVAVASVGGEGGETWSQVGFVGGEPAGAARLVSHILKQRSRPRPTRRIAYLVQGSRAIKEVRRLGFERDGSLILFERRATNG